MLASLPTSPMVVDLIRRHQELVPDSVLQKINVTVPVLVVFYPVAHP